ncbi:hypothetical protein PGT21_015293 [Puccinia graminis f. sp. tritici]|uniref:Uncharacterized protein n=1 Tax=Puccinia graminis f. sp. tritici TaxID=56615 RepID=A0A5B0N4D3_PUCGR|nr:hypothetical protein PGT21_015293 [Puccinia graminis f. sp. tritici]KAA1087978.1 hypothetical protein PGTUg99_012362 [Puccinia graminis f. sp. tritici]
MKLSGILCTVALTLVLSDTSYAPVSKNHVICTHCEVTAGSAMVAPPGQLIKDRCGHTITPGLVCQELRTKRYFGCQECKQHSRANARKSASTPAENCEHQCKEKITYSPETGLPEYTEYIKSRP